MLKKVIIFTVLSVILFSSFSIISFAFVPDRDDITVEGYYLFDLKHNMLIASENCDELILPSSTTKIMSACVVLDSGIDLEKQITISSDMIKNVSGRSMLLSEGDVLTVRDLLYAMVCGGYNDATQILAITVSSSIQNFTAEMNKKAVALGMNNTHYSNPTGIDQAGMHTTINDISKLVKYMSTNSLFVEICSAKTYKLSDYSVCEYLTITHRSELIGKYKNLSCLNIGGSDSGDCAVMLYNSSASSIISIVMNANSTKTSQKNNCAELFSEDLILHAINDYSNKLVKSKDNVVSSLPVNYSISSRKVNVYLSEDLYVFIPNNVTIDELTYSIYIKDGELTAPLKSGETVGTLTVFYDGAILTTVPLIVAEDVERNTFLYSMDVLKNFVLSKAFLIVLLVIIILIIIYKSSKKRKFRKKKRKTRKKPT